MYFFCNYWRLLTKKSFSNIACGLSFSLSHHTQTYTHILLKVDRNQTVSTRQWTNKEINLHIENNRKHNSNNNNLILVTLPPSNSASISMDLFLWSPEDTARTVPHSLPRPSNDLSSVSFLTRVRRERVSGQKDVNCRARAIYGGPSDRRMTTVRQPGVSYNVITITRLERNSSATVSPLFALYTGVIESSLVGINNVLTTWLNNEGRV